MGKRLQDWVRAWSVVETLDGVKRVHLALHFYPSQSFCSPVSSRVFSTLPDFRSFLTPLVATAGVMQCCLCFLAHILHFLLRSPFCWFLASATSSRVLKSFASFPVFLSRGWSGLVFLIVFFSILPSFSLTLCLGFPS